MKKIAYLCTEFPVLSETFVATEMRAMAALGHQIKPYSFHRPQAEFQPQDQAIQQQTVYLTELGLPDAIAYLRHPKVGLLKALSFVMKQEGLAKRSLLFHATKLAEQLIRDQCDHLHAHFAHSSAATAIVAARLANISVSFVGHGYDVYASPSDLALKLNSADFCIAVCKDMQHDFQKIAPNSKVGLVYCGIDPSLFPRKKHHFSAQNRLLYFGRICATKGVEHIIDALSSLHNAPQLNLDIVGDGDMLEPLRKYVKQRGLTERVHFLGSQSAQWFSKNCHNYDALVVPFKMADNGDRDTGPVVVKEAMALGLPVITTYFMGCKEMLSSETAIRVAADNPHQLAEAIKQLNNMTSHDIKTMADRAFSRVHQLFTASYQARRLSLWVERGEGLS